MRLWGLKESAITFIMGIFCGIIFTSFFLSRDFEEETLKKLYRWQADYIVKEYIRQMTVDYPYIPSGTPLDQYIIEHVSTGSFK